MIGEHTRRAIISALDQGGQPAEIAEGLGVPEGDVLLIAAGRLPAGGNETEDAGFDISLEQLNTLRQHAYSLATSAEDQAIQAKMTQYLIDRRAPVKAASTGLNFLQINAQIEDTRAKMAALIHSYSQPAA